MDWDSEQAGCPQPVSFSSDTPSELIPHAYKELAYHLSVMGLTVRLEEDRFYPGYILQMARKFSSCRRTIAAQPHSRRTRRDA